MVFWSRYNTPCFLASDWSLPQVMHDSVRLCNDRGQVLATYPAEKLAFSACCPDDRRFFGLVTMQATDDEADPRYGHQDDGGLRTSCHVFIVDPDLCHHQVRRQLRGTGVGVAPYAPHLWRES